MSFVAPAPQRVVRPAGRADAAQVVRLLENANEQYEKLLPAEIFDVYLADLRVLPFRTDVELAVVEFDSRIVGSVAFRSTASSPAGDVPGFAGFRALSVAPDARGVGVGRALALWAIGRARSINAKGVAIHSASFQTTAHNLYRSLGFVREPSIDFDAAVVLGPAAGAVSIPVLGLRLDLKKPATVWGTNQAASVRLLAEVTAEQPW